MNGGRVRDEVRLVGIAVSDEVKETKLSAAYARLLGPLPAPRWAVDGRFQPGIYATYAYAGSTGAADTVSDVLGQPDLNDAACRRVIETFLRLLGDDGDSYRAIAYAFSLVQCLPEQPETAAPGSLGPDDLPAPPEKE